MNYYLNVFFYNIWYARSILFFFISIRLYACIFIPLVIAQTVVKLFLEQPFVFLEHMPAKKSIVY